MSLQSIGMDREADYFVGTPVYDYKVGISLAL